MPKRFFLLAVLFLTLVSLSPVSAQSGDGPVYIVQSGDTLSSIAARFNISIADLMDANGISDPNLLAEGQELIIPGLQGVSGVLVTEYVQYGDSFLSLSRRTQVEQSTLRKLNRLVSPAELYVGTSLIVPQQERAESLNIRITPSPGESLFELAIKNNTSPWTLALTNQLEGTWQALPGDVLYASGDSTETTASGLPAVIDKASIRPLPLKQGGTAVIRVQVPEGVTLDGKLAGYPLNFFPDSDGSMVALQGIDALLDPGVYPILLEATLPDGTKQSFEQMVVVVSGDYPTESVQVASSTLDPTVTKPEEEKILTIVSPFTSQKFWSGQFHLPVDEIYCIRDWFTNKRSYNGSPYNNLHSGLDFGVCSPTRPFDIYAAAPGVVVFTGTLTVRGNATIIDHGLGIYTGYWHQSQILVNTGDHVEEGQLIGQIGDTGRVTGPHLHWEVWVNGVQVDPFDWLNNTYP